MFHAGAEPRRFFLPEIARGLPWWQFVNTGAASPRDIYPNLDGPAPPSTGEIELLGRSIVVYVARDDV